MTRHSNNGSSPDSESEGKGSIPLWRTIGLPRTIGLWSKIQTLCKSKTKIIEEQIYEDLKMIEENILLLEEDQYRLDWFLKTFGNTREGIDKLMNKGKK